MKVLVTGVTGQLGFDVVGELKRRKLVKHGPQHPVHRTVHDPALDRLMVDQQSAIDRRPFLDKESDLSFRVKAIDHPANVDRHGNPKLAGH